MEEPIDPPAGQAIGSAPAMGIQASQEEHGPSPHINDWSNFVSFSPRLYFKPQSLNELKGFLSAIAQGMLETSHIRVLGSLHSCSNIFVSDTIIDVSLLPKTLEFSDDNSVVTASANWTLSEFFQKLGQRGKSLAALGGTNAQTLAGIMSTNTAPATPKRSIYDLVNWVEYMTIDPITKEVVEKRVTRADAEFNAVVGSLGAIGIITKIQFRTVDQLFFAVTMRIMDMADALEDLDATSAQYDFWRVNWIPESDKALLWAARQIPREEADLEGDYDPDEAETVLNFVFMLWDRVSKGAAGPLLDNTMKVVYKYLMSPWNWEGLDYIVKFNFMYLTDVCKTEAEKALIRDHLRGLWDRLIQEGIPFKAHWGKINFMDPQFVAQNYQLAAFEKLIHPLFLNRYVAERVLGRDG
jgi:FAD/FMN-containing dehydrogenase